MSNLNIKDICVGKNLPISLIGGVNVIEDRETTLRVAEHFAQVTRELEIPFIFKASFDKANRSSASSFRGPGLEKGLRVLEDVKSAFDVPILTDVHEPGQAHEAAKVCDVLQIPAFLARQTDLVAAGSATGKAINIKKPQFMSPSQVKNVVDKVKSFGNQRVMLCERGTCFGYDNLIVDFLGFRVMRDNSSDAPIILDVTHALQTRAYGSEISGGRGAQTSELACSGTAAGIAGLFIEAHPDPTKAKCDGASALDLQLLHSILSKVKRIDGIIKGGSTNP